MPTSISVASGRYRMRQLVWSPVLVVIDHITPILATLHWLPVRQRLIFKTSVPVWKCLHDAAPVVKVDRRIRWHYTATILRLRIGARLTRYRNCKFHNGCRTISRRADGISRYSVPPSAGPLLPMRSATYLADLCDVCRRRLGLYGRPSPVLLCSLRGPPNSLDSDVYWSAQLC